MLNSKIKSRSKTLSRSRANNSTLDKFVSISQNHLANVNPALPVKTAQRLRVGAVPPPSNLRVPAARVALAIETAVIVRVTIQASAATVAIAAGSVIVALVVASTVIVTWAIVGLGGTGTVIPGRIPNGGEVHFLLIGMLGARVASRGRRAVVGSGGIG
ncbi:hypothetical protein BC938DRAFT_477220, partial [Jimgerdemannia flammicorona]